MHERTFFKCVANIGQFLYPTNITGNFFLKKYTLCGRKPAGNIVFFRAMDELDLFKAYQSLDVVKFIQGIDGGEVVDVQGCNFIANLLQHRVVELKKTEL